MPIGKTKITPIEKMYDWGLYFWQLPDGHLFHDGNGNLLNIQSVRGDLGKLTELRSAASHYGQPEGKPYFVPGLTRATEEEYAEQKDRLANGLIPNMNDLGAVYDAKKTNATHGEE
jgi:hypothetical protein